MLRMSPIYVRHSRNRFFSGVVYIGIYVGRLVGAEPGSLVNLPEDLPLISDAYIRLYHILVSIFVDQPGSSFTELFNVLRARAFTLLQMECSVDVHFLAAPLPAVAITVPTSTVNTSTTTPIVVTAATSVSQAVNSETSRVRSSSEPPVEVDEFSSRIVSPSILQVVEGRDATLLPSPTLSDMVMDYESCTLASPCPSFDDFDLDSYLHD